MKPNVSVVWIGILCTMCILFNSINGAIYRIQDIKQKREVDAIPELRKDLDIPSHEDAETRRNSARRAEEEEMRKNAADVEENKRRYDATDMTQNPAETEENKQRNDEVESRKHDEVESRKHDDADSRRNDEAESRKSAGDVDENQHIAEKVPPVAAPTLRLEYKDEAPIHMKFENVPRIKVEQEFAQPSEQVEAEVKAPRNNGKIEAGLVQEPMAGMQAISRVHE